MHRVSAFKIFANENRHKIREEYPELKHGKLEIIRFCVHVLTRPLGDVSMFLIVKWKELTDKEKKQYEDKAGISYPKFKRLFIERPKYFSGKDGKIAWLRQLEKQYGQEWYKDFYHWLLNRLHHPKPAWCRDSIDTIFRTIDWTSSQASWHPNDLSLQRLTYYLTNAPVSKSPNLYVGRYNGYNVGVIFDGWALDPPQVGMATLGSLKVQYVHLPMFTGLRMKESKDNLCLLVLGKLFAFDMEIILPR